MTDEGGFFTRVSRYAARSLRYWEPRRLVYNAVLGLVVLAEYSLASNKTLSVDHLLGLFMLAVLANVAYCAAYLPDLFVQFAGLDDPWRWGRNLLFTVGTLFAATIAHFFLKGIFAVPS